MKRMKKKIFFRRSKKGSVMVEFALALPVLLGILFFIIEFGNILYLSNSVNVIARSAARYASISPSSTTTQLATQAGASSAFSSTTALTLTVTPSPGTARSVGDQITVMVEWTYTPLVNPFSWFSNSPPTWLPAIRSTAISRVEVAS